MKSWDELVDPGTFEPRSNEPTSADPLKFPDYADTLVTNERRCHGDESVVTGSALIGGRAVELAWFDFSFFGGSMGEASGERLARAMERAATQGRPFVLRTATGGARMQEGMRSLVQMPKLVAARLALAGAHQPFVAVMGHPTTGGVLASLAALADVTVAEKGATIGFVGPRVAERLMNGPLPEGSHTAARAAVNGLVDEVLGVEEVGDFLERVLRLLEVDRPRAAAHTPMADEDTAAPDAWDAVGGVRDPLRSSGRRLLSLITLDLVELRGDRAGTEDPAVVTALARVLGRRCLIMAMDRAYPPGPGAYRKARRALEIAERLQIPVVTLVDTKGADPSALSESAGIAWEIARLFERMLTVEVPVVSVVTGEGGSGGALAFATADVLLAVSDSVFSVIAPEGAAEILWRDPDRAPEAARLLKLTAQDLLDLGVADALIPGPPDVRLGNVIASHLARLGGSGPSRERAPKRQDRWRNI